MAPLERHPHLLATTSPRAVYESDIDDGFTLIHSTPLEPELTKKPTGLPKKLRFADSVGVRWIEDKKQFPEEHKAQIWYKKKDFNRFKESCRRIVDWVDSRSQFAFGPTMDESEDDFYFCSRGLERYTSEGNAKFVERTLSKATDMYVLRVTGARPNELAELMAIHSAPCVSEALERAEQDALAAQEYQRRGRGRKTTNHNNKQSNNSLLPKVRAIWDQREEFLGVVTRKPVDREPTRSMWFH